MGERLDPKKELATWEDVVYSNMIQKGLMTKEEFSERVAKVHKTFMKQHPSGTVPREE